ncbi:MAG: biotin carboxylase N-terminal domain-containing protein [Acidobacteriota bacterium]
MMRRVLVANRGEIARRVIRTCRRMGVATVAVYSDADRDALHVQEANAAVRIGPPPAVDSYLNIRALLEAARESGADAVHPGYGFLSENADFAAACMDAGLTWIGPTPEAIRLMGSKTAARALALEAGVPLVPGHRPDDQSDDAMDRAVAETGLPALIKAVAGGGGKGMRIVRAHTDVRDAIAGARREAAHAFGNGDLYVERLIEHARHIEIQVFGDQHGHVLHLFERDCSLQRRHQKVIEEAPASAISDATRVALRNAAVALCRRANYTNAGTVEFLVEGVGTTAERFYFLEMNTRLQVEHPVTEAITGLDLVELQLRVAAGDALPITQDDVRSGGHAIECRLYAEDSRRLLPQSGRLLRYREPAGAGLRVDSGVREGQTIGVHYDPLIAKLIAHADTREGALDRLREAVASFEVLGVRTNAGFLRHLLSTPEVRADRADTGFIDVHLPEWAAPPPERIVRAAAALAARLSTPDALRPGDIPDATTAFDPWSRLGVVRW